ncbi:hypothetical protein [Alteraurantiacibacter aquimixticola]|uniref:Uncharacterized protein n=1 Tax=Alteraurantiacibacter aquimixticola TaxID=2489173 RepID=A0A4T3F6M9_9SPHN|nr:hypothetical protein [Alteraurantiacibacter aquimixticola]TIX51332.1 hypothetical protein E5222_02380 [Alteraurantiacibacter aquimixticola]
MKLRSAVIVAAGAAMALAGCKSEGDIVVQQGVGITALRSVCPAVGIPDHTGDITLFSPASATTADAIDVTAVITNVRANCDESGAEVYSTATFDVQAQRRDVSGTRTVEIPYFSTVMRGGSSVVAKRLGTVTLSFADGEARASAMGTAGAVIDRTEATLPADIREIITRTRRAGDTDAAIDPLTRPEVRAALARASFELLVGFQLSEDQLAYNATR